MGNENSHDVLDKAYKEILAKQGNPAYVHTQFCVDYKSKHDNCWGCEFEIGCVKLLRLKQLLLNTMLYKPNSYDDFAKMNNRIQELQELIIKTESLDELKQIPMF